jgi:hypothetical protein
VPQKQARNYRSNKVNPFDKYLKPEDIFQIQVCSYIKLQYPWVVIHHSPNEGKRSHFERYLMKKLMVSSGFPDLILFCRRKKLVIVLELKTGYNKPTDNQQFYLELFNEIGIPATWTNTFEKAKYFLDKHLA